MRNDKKRNNKEINNNYTEEERQAHGISLGLARISVGLENVEDLSADILKALDQSAA